MLGKLSAQRKRYWDGHTYVTAVDLCRDGPQRDKIPDSSQALRCGWFDFISYPCAHML